MSQQDPQNFFTCNMNWQICSFDFTFRKILTDTVSFKVSKFNVVQNYFYGSNDPLVNPRIANKRKFEGVKGYHELVVYRGYHICNSQTFMNYLPRMLNNKN